MLRFLMLRPAFGLIYQQDVLVSRIVPLRDLWLPDLEVTVSMASRDQVTTVMVGDGVAVLVESRADSTRYSILAAEPGAGWELRRRLQEISTLRSTGVPDAPSSNPGPDSGTPHGAETTTSHRSEALPLSRRPEPRCRRTSDEPEHLDVTEVSATAARTIPAVDIDDRERASPTTGVHSADRWHRDTLVWRHAGGRTRPRWTLQSAPPAVTRPQTTRRS